MSLGQIREYLAEENFSGLLIVDPINLRYITGAWFSEGTLLITHNDVLLFVDDRYDLLAHTLKQNINIHSGSRSEIERTLANTLDSIQGNVGFDDTTLSVAQYQKFLQLVPSLRLVAAPFVFSQMRRTKSKKEIVVIEQACKLCERGFLTLLDNIKIGVTELELVRLLNMFWVSEGGSGFSFSPIIAFGPNSACPHWHPSTTKLQFNSVILIDIGVKFNDYHSDMTRTIIFGEPDPEVLFCHALVEEVFREVTSQLKPGVYPHALDSFVRDFFAQKGKEEAFLHGLGHGVGLQIHEHPRISPTAHYESPLRVGDVIAIEPGIYIEGRGGVRLENVFVIEHEGARSLINVPLKYQIDL